MTDIRTKILAARYKAARTRPYLATALWAIVPIEKEHPGIPTMGVDKYWRMYYNPKFVQKQSMEMLGSLLIHEVWHLLRQHCRRAESLKIAKANELAWNVAADCEINDDMKAEGLPLPDEGCFPDKYGWPDGLLAEEYYNKIPTQNLGGGGKGKDGEGQGMGSKELMPGAGNCGSCAHGQSAEWEDAPEQKGEDGKRSGTPSVTSAEGDLISREVARNIQDHVKNRGDLPAGMKRWADAVITPPQVDWRKQLAAVVRGSMSTASGCVDYSYSRPSRRQGVTEVVLPAMRRPTPEVVTIVDTSGSMGPDELAVAINEVSGILRSIGTTGVQVIFCDAAVGAMKKVTNARNLVPVGGGGTDMRVGLEKANALRPKPDVVVCLTDGHTPWPDKPYKFKTVIGLVDNDNTEECPKWAKTVLIKTSQKRR